MSETPATEIKPVEPSTPNAEAPAVANTAEIAAAPISSGSSATDATTPDAAATDGESAAAAAVLTETPAKPTLPSRRRNAYRDDLADETLRGSVDAKRYVKGAPRIAMRAAMAMRAEPRAMASLDTEVLFGEQMFVFDEADGWAFVQLADDRYVGYVRADGLTADTGAATHRVNTVGTFVYPEANMKMPPLMHLSLNSKLRIAETVDRFARLATGGFVIERHIGPIATFAKDFVSVAERLEGTPYLWGGKTRMGLDCSGLVQIAMQAAGLVCPRDSDMQQAEVGDAIDVPADVKQLDQGLLQRGDLVFWPGHVGIMTDGVMMLHANGHHMATVIEPVVDAAERIARQTGQTVSAIKRVGRLTA